MRCIDFESKTTDKRHDGSELIGHDLNELSDGW